MKNKIIFNLFLLTTLLLSACGGKEEANAEAHEEEKTKATTLEITTFQFNTAGIKIGTVEQRGLAETVKASGKLDIPPANFAEVSTYVGGVIKSILVLEGDFVKKGQTIMILEHPDFVKLQEEYLSVKNNFSFLEKDYQRQKELYDQKVNSAKVFQEAESKYNAEKGKLASLESQLSMLSISIESLDKGNIARIIPLKAPIEGYIGHLKASLGSYAEPNKPLFDVINNSEMHVHLDVFEKDMSKLKVGQKVYVDLPNQEDGQIEAVIFSIGKMLNEETKSIEIHADIKNNKRQDLIPGVYVSAIINIAEKTVDAVPDEAIIRVGDKQYIFVVTDCVNPDAECKDECCEDSTKATAGKENAVEKVNNANTIPLVYKMVEIKTGASALGYTEIIPAEKVEEHAQIVVKGAYFLMSKLKSDETVGCCAPGEEENKEK